MGTLGSLRRGSGPGPTCLKAAPGLNRMSSPATSRHALAPSRGQTRTGGMAEQSPNAFKLRSEAQPWNHATCLGGEGISGMLRVLPHERP
eukprot:11349402-Alexandrium_andersonii.AAC.1